MNKIQKMIMSFAAVAMIVGGSAFTKAVKKSDATTFLVQVSSGVWEERMTEPSSLDCQFTQPRQCYYQVNDDTILTGDQYSNTDIDNLKLNNKIDDGDHSSAALYTGP